MEQAFLHKHVRQSSLVSQDVIINALLGMVGELKPGSKRALDNDLTAGTGSESDDSERARPQKTETQDRVSEQQSNKHLFLKWFLLQLQGTFERRLRSTV